MPRGSSVGTIVALCWCRGLSALAHAATPRRLAVCTNANACGRPGHGFGPVALDYLRVACDGSASIELRKSTCLTQCSKGVNARLDDERLLFGINTFARCDEVLREMGVGADPPDRLADSYEATAHAAELLDDDEPSAALEAVDAVLQSVLALAGRRARTTLAERRVSTWAASRWRESFYGSELVLRADLSGEYHNGAGKLVDCSESCGADGSLLEGTWSEDGQTGSYALTMSPDGLAFSGSADVGGETWGWSGERLRPEGEEESPSPRLAWAAGALTTRSRACVRLGDAVDAVRAAEEAVALCARLPGAWEALAEARDAADDRRGAAAAYAELLYLEPKGAPGLPQPVANRRREQEFTLARLRRELTGAA